MTQKEEKGRWSQEEAWDRLQRGGARQLQGVLKVRKQMEVNDKK